MARERDSPKCLYTQTYLTLNNFTGSMFSYSNTTMEALTYRGDSYKIGAIW
jgi:hypothetical protein